MCLVLKLFVEKGSRGLASLKTKRWMEQQRAEPGDVSWMKTGELPRVLYFWGTGWQLLGLSLCSALPILCVRKAPLCGTASLYSPFSGENKFEAVIQWPQLQRHELQPSSAWILCLQKPEHDLVLNYSTTWGTEVRKWGFTHSCPWLWGSFLVTTLLAC